MRKTGIVFIVRLRDNMCVWNSNMLKYEGEDPSKLLCWHFLYNYIQSLTGATRDPLGFFCKIRIYNEGLTEVEDIKYYYARKIISLSDKAHELLDNAVGYEMLLWNDEYIPQAMETIE